MGRHLHISAQSHCKCLLKINPVEYGILNNVLDLNNTFLLKYTVTTNTGFYLLTVF